MSKDYTEIQPKHGDIIAHCGHMNASDHHLYKLKGEAAKLMRPDGSIFETNWLVCCDSCLKKANNQISKVSIRNDAIWLGNEPSIYKDD